MSKILEYKENSLDLRREHSLEAGRYIIVPSTKHYGDTGRYYLNLYINNENYKIDYVNSNHGDLKEYKKGEIIREEEEEIDKSQYSDEFLKILAFYAKKVIFDSDEEA